MEITIFGFIWIALLGFSFFKKKSNWIIIVCILSMLFQSASVLLLGESGVGPQILSSIALIIWCIKSGILQKRDYERLKVSKYNLKIFLFIALFILAVLISYKVNKTNYKITNFALYFSQLVIYLICAFCMLKIKCTFTLTQLYRLIDCIVLFIAVIGIVQFLTTTGIFPRNNIILELLLYTKDTNSAYYWYDFYPRIFATFMEPSYCAPFLVGGFFYLSSKKELSNKKIILVLLLLIEILLTFSSTAYAILVICGVIYLIFSKNKIILKYIIPLTIAIALVLLLTGQLIPLLNSVIFEKMNSGSGYTREVWNQLAQEAFEKSMWVGSGYKLVRGSEFIWSILGQLGIIGLVTWTLYWTYPVLSLRRIEKNTYNMPILFFLLSSIIAMLIAIPDIDFIVFWFAMYVFMLYTNIIRKCEKASDSFNEK